MLYLTFVQFVHLFITCSPPFTLYFDQFGAENTTTGEWNGLVREIIDKNADLAVAAMTINYARESVIDFTKPFMNLGMICVTFFVVHC